MWLTKAHTSQEAPTSTSESSSPLTENKTGYSPEVCSITL